MSMEEPLQDAPSSVDVDTPMQDTASATAPAPVGKKRPRLDFNALGVGERKRGKSMFGVLVNTLNKAKAEDKERNASDAAKKRQLIDQRLQNKLKKDADSVRQAEEAKKDKLSASRKEEELQLKDSIYKSRRTRFPFLSNFLLTSDVIPHLDADSEGVEAFQLSSLVPPPITSPSFVLSPNHFDASSKSVYLNAQGAGACLQIYSINGMYEYIITQVKDAVEEEWENFKSERAMGVEDIMTLRQNVAAAKNGLAKTRGGTEQENGDETPPSAKDENAADSTISADGGEHGDDGARDMEPKVSEMDVDDGDREREGVPEKKVERPAAVDEDDAVEY
ncbi:hypothetical protein EW145_g3135 [Phellinidium pouzarii]|uniref:Pinin/SDK/MemA protein domain-containing protein n=1 Tax=Phellinidium pouzarii TaxID=167371 RepID=A0A4S4L8N9_9AGAM|nr:hypothetical protein EW145_g3135 [Phellinidium pouzarii]